MDGAPAKMKTGNAPSSRKRRTFALQKGRGKPRPYDATPRRLFCTQRVSEMRDAAACELRRDAQRRLKRARLVR